MRRNLGRRALIALGLLALFGRNTSEAQVTGGTIVGSVKDQQGAAVPGATVTITEVNKGTVSTYTTDPDEVAVELSGFKKHVHRGVVLQVNQRGASTRRWRWAASARRQRWSGWRRSHAPTRASWAK